MYCVLLLKGYVTTQSYLENFLFNFQISPSAIEEVLLSIIANLFNKQIGIVWVDSCGDPSIRLRPTIGKQRYTDDGASHDEASRVTTWQSGVLILPS